MRGLIKRHQRRLINRRLVSNRKAIDKSRAIGESFADREHLYMRHDALLERRDA